MWNTFELAGSDFLQDCANVKSNGRLNNSEGMGTYIYLQKRAIERVDKQVS